MISASPMPVSVERMQIHSLHLALFGMNTSFTGILSSILPFFLTSRFTTTLSFHCDFPRLLLHDL